MAYDLFEVSRHYASLCDGRLVAVNVFGEPFFDLLGILVKVSPETGDREEIGPVGEFPVGFLDDYWTGDSLKTAWEDIHGPVGDQHFLVPTIPFVLGGEFDVENLARVPIQEAVCLYQAVRAQVSGLNDGEKVRVEVKK